MTAFTAKYRWEITIGILLFGVTFALYSPTLKADFVYDDLAIIINDDYIHDPGNIIDILTLRIFSRDIFDHNRPISVLSTMIDSMIWARNPVGYHLTNNLIHALNIILLFGLLLHLLNRGASVSNSASRRFGAALGALIFGIHPINTEAVACVTYREDPLITFFLLAAILLTRYFNRADGTRRWGAVAGVAFCSFCAIGTKESGLVLPACLIVYWWFFRRKDRSTPWLVSIAGSALIVTLFTAASILWKFKGESAISWGEPRILGGSFLKMLTIEPSVFFYQIKQMLLPVVQSVAYGDYNLRYSIWQIAIPVVIILAGLAIWGSVKSRLFAFCSILFILLFAPVSNFMPKYQILADRFLYVPMIAVVAYAAMFGTWSWDRWKSRRTRTILLCMAIAVCTIYAVLAAKRIGVWNNSVSLWTDAINKNPMLPIANDNLGLALYERGEVKLAAAQFERELQLTNGKSADAYVGFTLLYAKTGMLKEAKECFIKAGNIDPRYKDPEKLQLALILNRRQTEALKRVQSNIEN